MAKLTLQKVKKDTLKYSECHSMTREQLSFRIGIDKSNLTRFLNIPDCGLHTKTFINLLNILYYDNETESSL